MPGWDDVPGAAPVGGFAEIAAKTWNTNQRNPSAADEIDMMAAPFHPADTVYLVQFWAEVDGDNKSSTQRIEIGLAELQAIRAILALRWST